MIAPAYNRHTPFIQKQHDYSITDLPLPESNLQSPPESRRNDSKRPGPENLSLEARTSKWPGGRRDGSKVLAPSTNSQECQRA